MDLTDVFRVFHPAVAQYTFFIAAHEVLSIIDILGHRVNLVFPLYSYIHMCIHCLGHFSPMSPITSYPPLPHFQAEPVLPFSPILLKRRHKQ
jgi:hypothetical protein